MDAPGSDHELGDAETPDGLGADLRDRQLLAGTASLLSAPTAATRAVSDWARPMTSAPVSPTLPAHSIELNRLAHETRRPVVVGDVNQCAGRCRHRGREAHVGGACAPDRHWQVAIGRQRPLAVAAGLRAEAVGEAYSNVRGAVRGFRNIGDTQAKLLNTLVVDKDAPRVQPAAQVPKQ